ncbi:hypothetical protein CDQ96_04260 (plasmid) [Borrelia miyamotoi]|uniref:hypothetical protein n=1 Tax=Borrelia miyamotoi TaxID=47466 RepID=UPI000B8D52FC|nr:hypothetical protein [Borrelia miyamotoi]ASQ29626.1 hypothetical protein CDQ96_04260 [Borrelia miyamotoi]
MLILLSFASYKLFFDSNNIQNKNLSKKISPYTLDARKQAIKNTYARKLLRKKRRRSTIIDDKKKNIIVQNSIDHKISTISLNKTTDILQGNTTTSEKNRLLVI